MTRMKALVILTVFVSASAVYAVVRVYNIGNKLGRVQQQLIVNQRALVVSQKASTETRVTTVGQRCDLTHLILGVLVRVHDTSDAAPFQASLHTCKMQLATVKLINAKTSSLP